MAAAAARAKADQHVVQCLSLLGEQEDALCLPVNKESITDHVATCGMSQQWPHMSITFCAFTS